MAFPDPPSQVTFWITLPSGANRVSEPWNDWFRRLKRLVDPGISTTVTLAKITGGGTDGSLEIVNGVIVSITQPT